MKDLRGYSTSYILRIAKYEVNYRFAIIDMIGSSRNGGVAVISKLWEILDEKDLFRHEPWIQVSTQTVRLPDGRIVEDYLQFALPNFAVMVAQIADGRIICERSYKHGARRLLLTLPGGMVEPGETALAGAQRELLEETGYVSDEWRFLGQRVMNANAGGNAANIFVARNCRQVAEPNPGDLEEITIELMTPGELLEAFMKGEMPLGCDSVALLPAIFELGIVRVNCS